MQTLVCGRSLSGTRSASQRCRIGRYGNTGFVRQRLITKAAGGSSSQKSLPSLPPAHGKAQLVERLLAAKEASGKSFSDIAAEVGLTNVYTAQLFYHQQQLQPNTVDALRAAVPGLSDADISNMMRAPYRRFDPDNLQEPSLYRLYEAITHGGEAIKAIINEELGDGIMSAIGFYCTVDKAEGLEGEPRVIITFNGKFLPYVEQQVQGNIAQRQAGV